MTRVLLFLAIAVLVFAPFNWITYRQLVRIHPRRRRWILGALIAGNAMWPFFPLLRSSTDFARVMRAVLGPLWFGWTSFAILYSILVFLVLLAWVPFRRVEFARFARWPSRVFLSVVLVGFAIGYVHAIVPLRVERVTVRVPNLPASSEGTKLVLMGDLHVGLFTRPSRLERIFATAGSLQPDAVLIAGDLIDDDPYFVPKLLAGTRALPANIPLYAVLGNHEMYGDPVAAIEAMRGSRMRLLVNEGVPLRDLWIAGVSDPAAREAGSRGSKQLAPDLASALAGKPANAIAIVLAHQPKILEEARRRGAALTLSAHTHGGQFGFRPLRLSLAGLFLRYHMGLYDLPPTQLYINTGTGYWLFPFRLGMTPEITLIELRRR
ncbi:MAG TPA: metallophosphoesterase [Thermoanaerobaculia bacterium]|nr:metallophosphoesterase [Thermoanaerobaculia bacterium]